MNSVDVSCDGRLVAAGGTHNRAAVWDVRRLSDKPSKTPVLHVLSHGCPAPVHDTLEEAGRRQGFVEDGDQGVNKVAFFANSPACLVTAGANGVGLWDTALGAPSVLWLPHGAPRSSHISCVCTAAVHPAGLAFATGGDDQRVVLYTPRGSTRLALPIAVA